MLKPNFKIFQYRLFISQQTTPGRRTTAPPRAPSTTASRPRATHRLVDPIPPNLAPRTLIPPARLDKYKRWIKEQRRKMPNKLTSFLASRGVPTNLRPKTAALNKYFAQIDAQINILTTFQVLSAEQIDQVFKTVYANVLRISNEIKKDAVAKKLLKDLITASLKQTKTKVLAAYDRAARTNPNLRRVIPRARLVTELGQKIDNMTSTIVSVYLVQLPFWKARVLLERGATSPSTWLPKLFKFQNLIKLFKKRNLKIEEIDAFMRSLSLNVVDASLIAHAEKLRKEHAAIVEKYKKPPYKGKEHDTKPYHVELVALAKSLGITGYDKNNIVSSWQGPHNAVGDISYIPLHNREISMFKELMEQRLQYNRAVKLRKERVKQLKQIVPPLTLQKLAPNKLTKIYNRFGITRDVNTLAEIYAPWTEAEIAQQGLRPLVHCMSEEGVYMGILFDEERLLPEITPTIIVKQTGMTVYLPGAPASLKQKLERQVANMIQKKLNVKFKYAQTRPQNVLKQVLEDLLQRTLTGAQIAVGVMVLPLKAPSIRVEKMPRPELEAIGYASMDQRNLSDAGFRANLTRYAGGRLRYLARQRGLRGLIKRRKMYVVGVNRDGTLRNCTTGAQVRESWRNLGIVFKSRFGVDITQRQLNTLVSNFNGSGINANNRVVKRLNLGREIVKLNEFFKYYFADQRRAELQVIRGLNVTVHTSAAPAPAVASGGRAGRGGAPAPARPASPPAGGGAQSPPTPRSQPPTQRGQRTAGRARRRPPRT